MTILYVILGLLVGLILAFPYGLSRGDPIDLAPFARLARYHSLVHTIGRPAACRMARSTAVFAT